MRLRPSSARLSVPRAPPPKFVPKSLSGCTCEARHRPRVGLHHQMMSDTAAPHTHVTHLSRTL